jgi:predicted RNase H-like HicB family nuclease
MAETITLDEIVVPITLEYHEEDQVYQVSCPVLQGCHAWGETLDEAMRSIPGNIRTMLQGRRKNGSDIPKLFENASEHTPLVLRMVPA